MSLVNAVIIWLLVIVILLFFCFKEVVLRMLKESDYFEYPFCVFYI